jgi:hypothetical protein
MTLPILWSVILFALRLVALAVISLWVGVPRAVDNIANEWLDRAIVTGFPTQYDRQLYYVLWTLGLLTVLVGWVIFSYITVGIVHLIF